ncbi:hypothetical protein DPMN_005077 [Dreissena polymorpha]|uniref:Uncharacterized protein n=1 Tax=Dreissena polymorpha TaxID=45954 RepID=A0A9D4MSS9_DREPO|nr:hypothetical protein DPMN_005077 [Dreissena polymorpha]
MCGPSSEVLDLTYRLCERAGEYGMEFSAEKSTIITNNTSNTSAYITYNPERKNRPASSTREQHFPMMEPVLRGSE